MFRSLFVLLALFSSYSYACITQTEAQESLAALLSDESQIEYPDSFDQEALFENLHFWKGHYHSQTEFRAHVDFDCGPGYVCEEEQSGPYYGVVVADVACSGKARLLFSLDHD